MSDAPYLYSTTAEVYNKSTSTAHDSLRLQVGFIFIVMQLLPRQRAQKIWMYLIL